MATFTYDGTGYQPVDSWALKQSFVPQGTGIGVDDAFGVMLRLESVQHTGKGGTDSTSDDVTLPANRFGYTALRNRVERPQDPEHPEDPYPGMERHRVNTVRTESGSIFG
ncbi:hypothetical protein PX701_12335 [Agromyces sp. H3Y2-19a]|uniref:hypothetical protein n=1 Tax=Agromyces chromiiresistens TaxID=3030835 RepID=UPI0023B9C07F|nr:hypothetical protein [Agromyces chromiiresistens]MDF0514413.1 hypothetical protein [Agromyces chromiiresistens]